MNQELEQINEINNLSQFKVVLDDNSLLKSLPVEIIQAVLDRDLTITSLVEIVKVNDERFTRKVIEVVQRKKKYEKNIINLAKFAVKKSDLMKKKMSNLKSLTDQKINLSSVWDLGKRNNYAGDSSFHGNAPSQVVEQCILRLTDKKDKVLDPMAGSGTTIDVCRVLGRRCLAYDLNPTRVDITRNDSSNKIPLASESMDMVFLHPPYHNMVKYSRDKKDLSNQSFDDFLNLFRRVLIESKRVLKLDRYVCILVGDWVNKGKFIPLSRKIANIAESLGLEDCGQAIKLTYNSVSQVRRGKAIYAELAQTQNLKINHDHVMFWKKISHQ